MFLWGSYEVPIKFLWGSDGDRRQVRGCKISVLSKKLDKNIIGLLERQLKSIRHQLKTIFITTISDNYIQQLLTIAFFRNKNTGWSPTKMYKNQLDIWDGSTVNIGRKI